MNPRILAAFLLVQPILAQSGGNPLWEGGLWNLDYPDDISTYGYFRVFAEPSIAPRGCSLLRIEWIERVDDTKERVFASRLISEPELCLEPAGLKVSGDPEQPWLIEITNAKRRRVRVHLQEPGRFEVLRVNAK